MTPQTLTAYDSRDKNEPEIIAVLVEAGAMCLQMPHQVGFDLLVVHPSGIYIAEVKQPGRKLTPREDGIRIAVELHGQKYHVLRTIDDALRMLDMKTPEWSDDEQRYE